MLKTSPQVCLDNFQKGAFKEKNSVFLKPVYNKLYKGLATKINLTPDYLKQIDNLRKYFKYLEKIKQENKRLLQVESKDEQDIVVRFIKIISDHELKKASDSLEKILIFLCKNRKNINGLEIINWLLFGTSSLDELNNIYIVDPNGKSYIKNALLGYEFNSLIIENPGFSDALISDLLSPVEIINPKRRQGLFDKEVFKLIADNIVDYIGNFQFETKIKNVNDKFVRENTNWLLTEKKTGKIKFPKPKNSKKIDMLCKIKDKLFIGSHKEQQNSGGGQANQATDASFLFDYTDNQINEIKKIFNVKEVYLIVFLETREFQSIMNQWQSMIKIVKASANTNKYLLSSRQFIELLKLEFSK